MTVLCSLVPRYDDILLIIDILKCFFTHVIVNNYFNFEIKIVETRTYSYRDINIIICIKQLKKFEGGQAEMTTFFVLGGGLSNNDGP